MNDIIHAFDVDSYNKPSFDFRTAWGQGFRAGYIKLGGDNLTPRYRGNGYLAQFQKMVDAGFEHRGSYWVTGGNDPAASARFYLANVDPRTTFHVLDNETLDQGRSWSDAEACVFFDILAGAGLTNLIQYGSRDALWNAGRWDGLRERGVRAIVALYNNAPFTNVNPRTYPAELVVGHQYTSAASIGGLSLVDANVFTASAFTSTTTTKDRKKMAGKISTIRATADGVNNTDQLFWERADGSLTWIQSPADLGLLQRYAAASDNNAFDHFFPAEIERLNTVYLNPATSIVTPAPVDLAELAKQIVAAGGTQPDVAAIAKAVNDDAAARLAH